MRTCLWCLRRHEFKPAIDYRALMIALPIAAFLWLMVILAVLWMR